MKGLARLAALLAVVLALSTCGLPAEDSARPIDPPVVQPSPTLTPAPTGTGARDETLYFIRDHQVVPTVRHVQRPPAIDALIQDLLAGPTDAERDAGLTSALPADQVVARVDVSNELATIELAAAFDEAARTDQILAVAQLVCTAASTPSISAVAFTRDGQRIGVPRSDGSLTESPLRTTDYNC